MPVKSGVTTSEFWVTIITAGLSFLTAFSFKLTVSNEQIQAIAAVAAMLASAITTIVYTHSRSSLKRVAIAAAVTVPAVAPALGVPAPKEVIEQDAWLADQPDHVGPITAPLPAPPPPVVATSGL